jgi:hypothetical protein
VPPARPPRRTGTRPGRHRREPAPRDRTGHSGLTILPTGP